MKKLLFIGDVNVDILLGGLEGLPEPDREIRCHSFQIVMGSSAAIAACAYAALGGAAALAGLAGRDQFGEFMLEGLREAGVDTTLVERSATVPTGVTVNLIQGSRRSQVTFPGAIEHYAGRLLRAEALARFDHLHFAGPYQQTRLRPALTTLLRTARGRGCTTSLDPQWDSCRRWEFMSEWLPLLDFLFLNRDEALSLTGASRLEEALGRLAARTSRPILKDGRQGAWLQAGAEIRNIPTWPIAVVDTTGAGDVFDATFLFAFLERGFGLEESVRLANAGAARSCTFSGGTAARSSWDQVLATAAQTPES